MRKKKPGEHVARLRIRAYARRAQPLRERLEAWAEAALPDLAGAEPDLPSELSDRQQDCWEPILAISDLAGEGWPERARAAAVELHRASGDEDLKQMLLADLAVVLSSKERMFSEDVVSTLSALEDRPWGAFKDGAGMTKWTLASMLKPFEVAPRQIRIGEVTRKGYDRADFEDLWERYPPPTETRNTAHSPWPGHMDGVSSFGLAGEGAGEVGNGQVRERLDWSLVLERVRAVLDGRPQADVATVVRITGFAGETAAEALAQIRGEG
jgi:Protein of unknown function (DUF3631)